MRPNYLPDIQEIVSPIRGAHFSSERVRGTRVEVIQLIEDYTGFCINVRRVTEELYLSPGKQLLSYRPSRDVEIEGRSDFYTVQELGVFDSDLPLGVYQVSYETGYPPGSLPAILKELVLKLTQYRLVNDTTYSGDLFPIMQVVKRQESEIEKRRASDEID